MSYLNSRRIPTAANTADSDRAGWPVHFAVECDPCGLFAPPLPTYDAAEELAGLHDDRHHDGALTAHICPKER